MAYDSIKPGDVIRRWRQELIPQSPDTQRTMTVSDAATIYGCCGLFDLCDDMDLMSLSFAGAAPFLDWIGWSASLQCNVRKGFISYTRPAQARAMLPDGPQEMRMQQVCTGGALADPCATPNGIEWGKCEFLLHDWGRIRRIGETRDVTKVSTKLCEIQPRYRLDGSLITNDREFDLRMLMEVIIGDLKGYVIDGNHAVAGQFDGLNQLIKTNYLNPDGLPCNLMDSIIVNWNGNDLDGGAGITWNGVPQPATADFVEFLLAIYRRFKQRISWAPALASQNMRIGDMVIMAPSSFIPCLLDAYACWSVCPNSATLISKESRDYRQSLNGGLFGAGRIFLDGFEIPLVPYDWGGLQQSPTISDVYFLTGSVGPVKLLEGQYLDMRPAVNAYPGGLPYAYTDGGRILTGTVQEFTCIREWLEMAPRILAWAPWASARIENVACHGVGPVLGDDPCSSYFPITSFVPASCPPH